MSALAQECGAVNLGQGFPDFDCDPRLPQAVTEAMQAGRNQYPPMAGVPALHEGIARKVEALYGRRCDPTSEITVTAGAPQRQRYGLVPICAHTLSSRLALTGYGVRSSWANRLTRHSSNIQRSSASRPSIRPLRSATRRQKRCSCG